MKLIIKGIGIFILLVGILLLIKPDIIFGWLENNIESTFLYVTAIVFRLTMGILFIVAAKQSKYPRVIKFIGYLAILAALIFLFMGHESFQELFSPLISNFKDYAPISAIVAMALGGFLVYAFTGTKEVEQEMN